MGEYKDFKMILDSGCPAMFWLWLYVDTAALYDLQAFRWVWWVEIVHN